MEIKKLTKSSTVFIYNELEDYLTNVYVLNKKNSIYIIDSFCGDEIIKPVEDYVNKIKGKKDIVLINTHFHWDHIWGNIVFKNNKIISHKLCKDLSEKNWEKQINKNSKYIFGKIEKVFANIIFDKNIFFEKDGIEIFYTPGHTIDSISVFDKEDEYLYVGDNLERPIIYLESNNIKMYIESLENYKKYSPKKIHSGHNLNLNKDDIENTIIYLENILIEKEIKFKTDYEKKVHNENLKYKHNLIKD